MALLSLSIRLDRKFNFFKISFQNKKNFIKKQSSAALSLSGRKVLRFRKPSELRRNKPFIQSFLSNQNLIQFKVALIKNFNKLGYWIKAENYSYVLTHFSELLTKFSWGKRQKTLFQNKSSCVLQLAQIQADSTLLFSLKFLLKTLQFYLSKSFSLSFGGLTLMADERYWSYFPYLRTNLINFWVGSTVFQGTYKNFNFAESSTKGALLLGKSKNYAKILLPSKKIVFLEADLTRASKTGLASTDQEWVSDLGKKASTRRVFGRKPRVRGKAMNVFDHPNGGFKHSSKLLKTFKGKKILK